MKMCKYIMVAAGILAAISPAALAQPNVVTVTNVVTVLVTNIVTLTNVVAVAPAATIAPVPAPAAPVKYPWKSAISAGISLTRGNSQTLLTSAEFLTEKKQLTDEYSLGGGVAYGTQDSKDTVNNYKAFGQWNHLFNQGFYGYLRANYLRDTIADLDYRITIGPGVGYYLIKSTNTSFAMEAGGGEEFQRLGGKSDSFATVRLAERFEHKFQNRSRLWQSVEFFPQVDAFDNYVINFEIGLEAPLSKSLSLKVAFNDTYANQPAAGRQKNDSKFVAGVSYKF